MKRLREALSDSTILHSYADCDAVLRQAKRRGAVISDFDAQGGEEWTCTCGRLYVHVCDEAEGCSWHEVTCMYRPEGMR